MHLVMQVLHRKMTAQDLVHAPSAEHVVSGDTGPVDREQLSACFDSGREAESDRDELWLGEVVADLAEDDEVERSRRHVVHQRTLMHIDVVETPAALACRFDRRLGDVDRSHVAAAVGEPGGQLADRASGFEHAAEATGRHELEGLGVALLLVLTRREGPRIG